VTMTKKRKSSRLKSLSQGRPPTTKPLRSLSSKVTRTLIRTHHTLEKKRAKALSEGDEAGAAAISQQIDSQGGIQGYQYASLVGQRSERGGDSSKILMEWLQPLSPELKTRVEQGRSIRMLEVGALSVTNACSKSRLFEMERIDLNSQEKGIKEQDFMERPLPQNENELFDIISLSLVLNYVPDAIGKGNMLLRTLKFLKANQDSEHLQNFFPSLFLVLPAPCVRNSRYLDEGRLEAIMESLGYNAAKKKISKRLIYYLWKLAPIGTDGRRVAFRKAEIRSGKDRNNFAIVLD